MGLTWDAKITFGVVCGMGLVVCVAVAAAACRMQQTGGYQSVQRAPAQMYDLLGLVRAESACCRPVVHDSAPVSWTPIGICWLCCAHQHHSASCLDPQCPTVGIERSCETLLSSLNVVLACMCCLLTCQAQAHDSGPAQLCDLLALMCPASILLMAALACNRLLCCMMHCSEPNRFC